MTKQLQNCSFKCVNVGFSTIHLQVTDCGKGKMVTFERQTDEETILFFPMLGSRRRPTIKTKNNKTELLNPEEGEDNMGDAVGKKNRGIGRCMQRVATCEDEMFFQSKLTPVI